MTYVSEEGDLLLHVTGILPAADFHPFVIRRALRCGLRGWVRHDSTGAMLRVVGTEDQLVQLVRAILKEAPASLRVRSMDPGVINAETPSVGDTFVALVEETEGHDPAPENHPPLARVA